MSSGSIYVCLVPATWWSDKGGTSPHPEFAHFAREALEIERRLPKRVDMERNLARYTTCCERIVALIQSTYEVAADLDACHKLVQAGHVAAMCLGESYLALLGDRIAALGDDQIAVSGRLGAMFFPPPEVTDTPLLEEHRKEFARLMQHEVSMPQVALRLALIDLAIRWRCGIIELHDMYADAATGLNQVVSAPSAILSVSDLIVRRSANETESIGETISDQAGRRRSQNELMRAEIERALATGQVVNFNNYRNDVISEILHEFVYRKSGVDQQRPLKVVYGDGSQAKPFPLFNLSEPSPAYLTKFEQIVPLRVALLSIRHVEMDSEVDMAWFRNSEASLRRMSYADTDAFCYGETIRQLDELNSAETLLIHLYQTGLEPAVVGFYRGLVEYLRRDQRQRARVAVVPRYFRGVRAQYRSGQMWI